MVVMLAALAWALTLLLVVAICAAARRGEGVRVDSEAGATRSSAPAPPRREAPTDAPLQLGRAA